MHPAKSVIFFTTASGAGYGLIFWSALFIASGQISYSVTNVLLLFMFSLTLITAGLLSSTFHLGHPERAWRAMSQWRTSWLSREGVCSLVTYVPIVALAWFWFVGASDVLIVLLSALVIAFSIATVVCTAMIYASLKPIAAWHNPATVVGYILYAVSTGAVLLWWIGKIVHLELPMFDTYILVLLLLCVLCKYWHWYLSDRAGQSTLSTATGLGNTPNTRVRSLDHPHDSPNYLMKEMGFVVARRHAALLRRVATLFAFVIPALGIGLVSTTAIDNLFLTTVPVVFCAIGIVVERWLFFAQAFHVVSLYYGGKR